MEDTQFVVDRLPNEVHPDIAVGIDDPDVVHEQAQKSLKTDLLIAAILFTATVLAFIGFDFFEWFFEYSRQYERWELDEFIACIPAFAIATAWFGIRRWRHGAQMTRKLEASLRRLLLASEDMAMARERAEQASHVKSVFLSMMSDEIRLPMNGIVTPVEELLKTDLDEEQYAQAVRVLQSSRSLLRSIDDILELSALETGSIAFNYDHIETGALLNTVEEYFGQNGPELVELSFYVDPVLPKSFISDQTRLHQIIYNLFENAAKFTDTGGIAFAICLERKSGGRLFIRFDVTDTGAGISSEHISSVFDTFAKPTAADGRARPGAGIGLAICGKLVGYLGGEIGVESNPGSGSRFWFTIPLSNSSEPLEVDESSTFKALNVLVVDDLSLTRDTIKAQVSSWGATVETATFGAEAMAMLRKAIDSSNPFDVLLVDSQTMTKNDYELAIQIRDDIRLENLKVICSSADTLSSTDGRGEFAQITSILRKPIRPIDLKNALQDVRDAASSRADLHS